MSLGENDSDEHHLVIDMAASVGAGVQESASSPAVKVTPYRLLNTTLVSLFGLSKAVMAYKGQSTAPTSLDFVMGVVLVNAYSPHQSIHVLCINMALGSGYIGWVTVKT
jgi:hypothetical protein